MNSKLCLRLLNVALVLVVGMLLTAWPVNSTGQASDVTDPWSMFGHDGAHTSRSSANGPNSADLAWTYTDGVLGDVVVGPDGTIYG